MNPLLTADWNNLVVLNYEIDPAALIPYLPPHTEPDFWNNKCYISLVAFQFRNPKIRGIALPFYRNFEQVNLRFYVRYSYGKEIRKGVVFIKEIAAGKLLKAGAALLYNEHYTNLPTRHAIEEKDSMLHIKYEWNCNNEWNYIDAVADMHKTIPRSGSVEAFITNRFWGYTKVSVNKTVEFCIAHQPWNIHVLKSCRINCSSEALYGKTLHSYLTKEPALSFMMDGSFVKVYNKKPCGN